VRFDKNTLGRGPRDMGETPPNFNSKDIDKKWKEVSKLLEPYLRDFLKMYRVWVDKERQAISAAIQMAYVDSDDELFEPEPEREPDTNKTLASTYSP